MPLIQNKTWKHEFKAEDGTSEFLIFRHPTTSERLDALYEIQHLMGSLKKADMPLPKKDKPNTNEDFEWKEGRPLAKEVFELIRLYIELGQRLLIETNVVIDGNPADTIAQWQRVIADDDFYSGELAAGTSELFRSKFFRKRVGGAEQAITE